MIIDVEREDFIIPRVDRVQIESEGKFEVVNTGTVDLSGSSTSTKGIITTENSLITTSVDQSVLLISNNVPSLDGVSIEGFI